MSLPQNPDEGLLIAASALLAESQPFCLFRFGRRLGLDVDLLAVANVPLEVGWRAGRLDLLVLPRDKARYLAERKDLLLREAVLGGTLVSGDSEMADSLRSVLAERKDGRGPRRHHARRSLELTLQCESWVEALARGGTRFEFEFAYQCLSFAIAYGLAEEDPAMSLAPPSFGQLLRANPLLRRARSCLREIKNGGAGDVAQFEVLLDQWERTRVVGLQNRR